MLLYTVMYLNILVERHKHTRRRARERPDHGWRGDSFAIILNDPGCEQDGLTVSVVLEVQIITKTRCGALSCILHGNFSLNQYQMVAVNANKL